MMKQHATTLILVVLAAVAAVVVFVVDRGSVSTNEAELRKWNLLELWRPDEITELFVTVPSGTTHLIRASANDAGQRLFQVEIDGQRYAADEQLVDQFLGTLEFATFERRVSNTADQAVLGIHSSTISIVLIMDSRRQEVVIGGSAPSPAGAVYAEVKDRGVFVITKQLASALDMSPKHFRSKAFVPYISTELSGIHLDGLGGARHFVRAAWGGSRGGGFRFDGSTPEGNVRVNAEALDDLWTTLGRMQAEAFLSDEQADHSLKTQVTLTLVPTDSAAPRGIIDVGGSCPDKPELVVAVRRQPTRANVCIPQELLESLITKTDSFVDLSLIGAPLDEINDVKFSGDSQTLELARTETGWHVRAPEDRMIDGDLGQSLVQSILDVEAIRLVPDAPETTGLTSPRATLRVVSAPHQTTPDAQDRVETLEFGVEQKDFVYVRRLEDGAVAELPTSIAQTLMPSSLSLRPRKIFDFEARQLRSLRIQQGSTLQQLKKTADGTWELQEPEGRGLEADQELADELASVLGDLEALRWASADAKDGFGLTTPRLVIEADVASNDEAQPTRRIHVDLGDPTSSGSFARSSDDSAVFVAPGKLETAAGRLLINRSVFAMKPDQVAKITLTPLQGSAVVVERSGAAWKVAKPSDETAATTVAAAVRDALANLQAEVAMGVGKASQETGLEPPRLSIVVELLPMHGKKPAAIRIAIGKGDSFQGINVVYARKDDVDATYVLAQANVRPLLEAVGLK